jgi:hypothetical protein
MSTLTVSNVSDGTLSIPTTYVTNGSAKAWVNFNGTGTIAARDSLNLSSLTDNGTGDYTVNFSSAFGAVDYIHTGTSGNDATGNSGLRVVNIDMVNSLTSAGRVLTSVIASGINRQSSDDPYTLSAFHGDLA